MSRQPKELRPSVAERIRWVALGLIAEDTISDVSQDEKKDHFDKLRHALQEPSSVDPSGGKPRYTAPPVIVATMIVAALVSATVWSVKSAIANQRNNARQKYVEAIKDLALDLYEEDLEVITQTITTSEQEFPTTAFFFLADPTEAEIQACREAIASLQMVRMGFPETGLQNLESATQLLDAKNTFEREEELEFVFNFVSGKALLEARDIGGNRTQNVSSSRWILTNTAIEMAGPALIRAEQLLRQREREGSSVSFQILLAAIEVDLGRFVLKGTPAGVSVDRREVRESLQKVADYFELAASRLDSLPNQDMQVVLHQARLLNHQLLLEGRFARISAGAEQDLIEFLQLHEQKIDQLAENLAEVAGRGERARHAADFEIAICDSNLADVITSHTLANDWFSFELTQSERRYRRRAIERLRSIPPANRTERVRENLALNHAQYLWEELREFNDTEPEFHATPELMAQAKALHWELGDILNPTIGQLSIAARIAVAITLPEEYTNEEIEVYFNAKQSLLMPRDRDCLFRWIQSR